MVGNMISLNIITSMFHLQNHNQNDYGLFVRSVSWKTNANKCKYKYLWLWAIGSEHLMKRPTTTPRRMKVKTVPSSKTSKTWNFISSCIFDHLKEICYWYFDKERYQSYGQWFLQIRQQLNFSNWSEHQKLW